MVHHEAGGDDMKIKSSKIIFAGVLASFALGVTVARAATNSAPSVKSSDTTASAARQRAAFGVESIKLGGIFGHRIDTMIKGNLLKLDMERDYLSRYRSKEGKAGAFVGIGFPLDAMVRFCAFTGEAELTSVKDLWMDGLISTQEPDGFIGTVSPKEPRYGPKSVYAQVEMADTLLALVSDYRIFGRKKILDAAVKLGDCMVANWTAAPTPFNYIYDGELALMELSAVSGDQKYLSWVKKKFLLPGDGLPEDWTKRLGGDPRRPLKLEGMHIYRWCDINLAMLKLGQHVPDNSLQAPWPQMIAWLKDGGSLPTGSFGMHERWRRSQTTRSWEDMDPEFPFEQKHRTKICESCAKFYVMQLLDRVMEVQPDAYLGDVMERSYYNGIFASQSPDGRKLHYGLSVEGARVPWPIDIYCCPGNLRRAFAYLPGYVYKRRSDGIYVVLYSESDATIQSGGGVRLRLRQKTDYPASGRIRVEVHPSEPVEVALHLRIPAWCEAPRVRVNGEAVANVRTGSYCRLLRKWNAGDVVDLDFPMAWRWLKGIREQEGRACLARGPVVFAFNPFRNGISEFQDFRAPPGWYNQLFDPKLPIPGYKDYDKGYELLGGITLDPSSLTEPAPDLTVHPFGLNAGIKGWMGEPKGPPTHAFVLSEFVDPQGRKIYFRLKDPTVAVDDELFGREIHERTAYPARWAALKAGMKGAGLARIPDEDLLSALIVAPLRGSHEFEVAKGELAGRPAWMSASLAQTGKRRMEFRVHDGRFQNGATPEVTLSVLYLDKGDCNVSLVYDSSDDVVRVRGRAPGAFKPGGELKIGNTGTIKRHDFKLPDARFAKNLLLEGTDFRLVANKDTDFVILGAFIQPAAK